MCKILNVLYVAVALSVVPMCANAGVYHMSEADSVYLSLVEKADSAIGKEDWGSAENFLLTAMRGAPANPTNVMLLSNLAVVQYQQGKDSTALATINDAYYMAPRSITVLSHRARIHKALGMVEEAYLDYGLMLEVDSTLIEPRYMHGVIALSNYDFITAQTDFEKMEKLAPDDDLTIDAMSSLYFYSRQYDKAIPYLERLIVRNPAEENYYNLATCHLMLEQLSEASTCISDAMRLYPLNGEFYLLRLWLNRLYYRHSDAEEDGRRAIELGVPGDRVKAILDMKLK